MRNDILFEKRGRFEIMKRSNKEINQLNNKKVFKGIKLKYRIIDKERLWRK